MKILKNAGLGKKFIGITMLSLISVFIVLFLTIDKKKEVQESVNKKLRSVIDENITYIAKDISKLLKVTNNLILDKVDLALKITPGNAINDGGISENRQREAIYKAFKQKELEGIKKSIVETKIGKKGGYVFVLGGKGEKKGKYIISKDNKRNNENILDTKDGNGKFFIREIVEKAITLDSGEIFNYTYLWKNKDEKSARKKKAAIFYFKEWDWVVGVTIYEDDYSEILESIASSMDTILIFLTIIFAIVILSIILINLFTHKAIIVPLKNMTLAAENLTHGDFSQTLNFSSGDEIGQLARSFGAMIEFLQSKTDIATKISEGDFSSQNISPHENDILGNAMMKMKDNINSLINEVSVQGDAIRNGKLKQRVNPDKFKGRWKELLAEINELVDAFVAPIDVTAQYVKSISQGVIPDKIEENYSGDFNEIKNNLNDVIDTINGIFEEVDSVISNVKTGLLESSGNSERFGGAWSRLVVEINQLIKSFIVMFNNLPNPIIIVNKNFKVQFANETALNLAEKSKSDIANLNCFNMFNNEHCETNQCAIGAALRTGTLTKASTSIEMHNQVYDVDYIGVPLKDSSGAIIGAMKVIIDQTEIRSATKKMEEIFRMSHISSNNLLNTSNELATLSNKMNEGINSASSRSANVATAAEQMSVSMSELASVGEQTTSNMNLMTESSGELMDSVRNIAKNVENANIVTAEAVEKMKVTHNNVGELGRSSEGITKVIDVINDIAEQTKLLALNASIEAARAGEAGKGFAVVANEVKELARQTGEATDDIKIKIEAIQNSVSLTIEEINSVNKVITNVDGIVTDIAAAAEEQAVTTDSMGNVITQSVEAVKSMLKNVSQTADVSRNIAKDIVEVDYAFNNINQMSSNIEQKAKELSETGEDLNKIVSS